jgi:mannose-6-phosphate isomerase-like protein (cupin superfamily)
MSYKTNIIIETIQNENFRKVLFTGTKSQLVVMDIPIGGDIGSEVHAHVEQTLFFLSGACTATVGDEQYICTAGDVVVVTPGTKHNFANNGIEPVKLYTVYSPANHIDRRVHTTKADADADTDDENYNINLIA